MLSSLWLTLDTWNATTTFKLGHRMIVFYNSCSSHIEIMRPGNGGKSSVCYEERAIIKHGSVRG